MTPYLIEDLAGKIATFVIKMHKVLKRKFHTLDNQFVEKLGIEKGVTILRAKVKENIKKDVHRYAEHQLNMRLGS
ncbi:hypothetical protein [Coxiella endosymbiont of Rhipicephalus microplus]|uniref:hypothetical protein n=1 Tax=Coxiella endosymbiont of Rhipicephalus microplus TaxID=1656186 RepID=UPI000CE58639|nr:hypothetical protein [Coxiella endosymbiont of Rhipicephalus microplus]